MFNGFLFETEAYAKLLFLITIQYWIFKNKANIFYTCGKKRL